MKTTLDISDSLLRRAKQAALERNTTLRAIVEEALARALGPAPAPIEAVRTVTWPPPGVEDSGTVTTEAVLDAIARARAQPLADPDWLARRLGLAPADRAAPAPRHRSRTRK